MYKLVLGKGARVLDMTKTPSGHRVIKVDEFGAATEDHCSTAFTMTANPRCEDAPLLVREAAGAEPAAGRPAASSARSATNGAHAYMLSQGARGIRFSINEETIAYTIQFL
eukprot:4677006-Pyramimonas_sp.AAC.1